MYLQSLKMPNKKTAHSKIVVSSIIRLCFALHSYLSITTFTAPPVLVVGSHNKFTSEIQLILNVMARDLPPFIAIGHLCKCECTKTRLMVCVGKQLISNKISTQIRLTRPHLHLTCHCMANDSRRSFTSISKSKSIEVLSNLTCLIG